VADTELYLCEWHLQHALTRLSTSRPIRDAIHPRRHALKNRERTNRMLMLMQMHANGDASESAYRKAILAWLLANGGRPRGLRRSITDPRGATSLR
jgi:hypothetical protein